MVAGMLLFLLASSFSLSCTTGDTMLPDDGLFSRQDGVGRARKLNAFAAGDGHPGNELPLGARVANAWNNSAAERRALEALYESAGGRGWVFSENRRNNWGEGECHCQWTDVTCMDKTACSASPVVKIDFSGAFANYGMNASGTLPGSVFAELTQLQHLALSGNPRLSGTLPATWATMI